ncbi:MAG: MerR family transcriptional regulator, light-induced transcriptional regulator [Pseudonocardiales bacterium]|jgi:CheY-like chemotaxis protein|nr:DNA-binding response regulator [Pseudonocardia sp.]MDT7652917.1 MerR family transcriptional regulator, light-induced transcriptional regulator [Pseudonocardiales bacterium]
MLGIPTATLRTWQDRYGVVVPERSPGGHRLYSRPQVEQLRFLRDQSAAGRSSADAHRLLQERLDAGVALRNTKTEDNSRLLILLAQQDRYAADFAEYFLRTEGYDVELVTDADDAVAAVGHDAPDLAVIDLLISGGRGLVLCAQLRATSDVPILAISPLALRDDALDAGASAFLQKPVDSLRLVAAIQDLVGRSALLRPEAAES